MKKRVALSDCLPHKDGIAAFLLFILLSVGVAGHRVMPEMMQILTPFFLWGMGLSIFWLSFVSSESTGKGRQFRRRLLLWMLITYVITFSLEVAGTLTGIIFGSYTYGRVLGVSFLSVPLVIGFNWVCIVFGIVRCFDKFPSWIAVMCTAVLTTAFDWIMEPVAMALGYWTWENHHIPIQNYVAWFGISAVSAALYRLLDIKIASRISSCGVALQAAFFTALHLVL